MKVLARTTNSWSLCRTNISLFSCGFPNQYSDVASQFFFFVTNHTHQQQQQQQQFKLCSAEQTQQSQFSHCSDTVRLLYTSQMNSFKLRDQTLNTETMYFQVFLLSFQNSIFIQTVEMLHLRIFKTQAPCAHPGTSPRSALIDA